MSWTQDLTMGAKFALSGGREGRLRTLLTAVGVGLGVTLLLISTAIPGALAARDARSGNRNDYGGAVVDKAAADTLLLGRSDTTFRGKDVRGRLLHAEGPKAPVPAGVRVLPRDGEMLVSPALADLLRSDAGKLLRERLPFRISGTITDAGLIGPHELAYYAGSDHLGLRSGTGVLRIRAFSDTPPRKAMDPVLALLVVIIFVVLLMPVAVFIAAAVRFGSDRRDRRLAALRLVGADSRMTRRIAAGEALAGALLGVVFGAGFFLLARSFVADVDVAGVNLFPSDLDPGGWPAALVAVAVPAAAVVVTLFTLRGVVIEPLGVVRASAPRRRLLWWRVLPPVIGLALLHPMMGQGRYRGYFNEAEVVSGTVLLLVGVPVLLPWLVETVVKRLGGGSTAWQLAVRRLQMSSGTAARLVNGIAVAVAGAIALQMLFTGIDGDYTEPTGADTSRAQVTVQAPYSGSEVLEALRHTDGVTRTLSIGRASISASKSAGDLVPASVGDCAALRELATIGSCEDGDAFVVTGGWNARVSQVAEPGRRLWISFPFGGEGSRPVAWTLPAGARTATVRADPTGSRGEGGVFITPGALPAGQASAMLRLIYVSVDRNVPDAVERVRNTVARTSPLFEVNALQEVRVDNRFGSVRRGLYIGCAAVLLLIGASLLVSVLEQLRDRAKLLAALTAFGTRRSTMSWSVLWQTAIPVALGLASATVVGLGLGSVLLRMVGRAVSFDWWAVAAMTGIGAGVVLLVTLLSLPPLWRLMRPDGLRAE